MDQFHLLALANGAEVRMRRPSDQGERLGSFRNAIVSAAEMRRRAFLVASFCRRCPSLLCSFLRCCWPGRCTARWEARWRRRGGQARAVGALCCHAFPLRRAAR